MAFSRVGCEAGAEVIAKGIDRFGNDSEFASGKTYTFEPLACVESFSDGCVASCLGYPFRVSGFAGAFRKTRKPLHQPSQ